LGSDFFLENNVLQKIHKIISELVEIDIVYGDVESNCTDFEFKGEYDLERLNNQNICHQAMFF